MANFKDNLVLIVESTIWEDSSPFLMARILKLDAATPAVKSDFLSIRYVVSERVTKKYITSGNLAIIDVIDDTLQTDGKWTRDAIGYNFSFTLPSAALPDANKEYIVTVLFTPNTGSSFSGQFRVYTEKVYYGVPEIINVISGDTYIEAIRGLPNLTNATKIWFVIKNNKYDLDSEALVKIEETVGLEVIEGTVAVTPANGSISIDLAASGDITVILEEAETSKLKPRHLVYFAIKALFNDGTTRELAAGTGRINLGTVGALI